MFNRTLLRAITTWVLRRIDNIDRRVFQEPDLDALARGWVVRRERRFQRVYRDPRWDLVTACPACTGTGLSGAARCTTCAGSCTVRREPMEAVRLR